MIKNIKLDKKLKSVIIISTIILILLSLFFIMYNYTQFNYIHKQQIKTTQSIVGTLIKEYPEKEEEIISSVLNSNASDITIGGEVLKKYGYDLELKMKNDPMFEAYRKDYFNNQGCMILIFFILYLAIIIFVIIYIYKYLNKISLVLDNFIKGNFRYEDSFNDEGMINVIGSQLNHLGKAIEHNYNKLENEKESAKALVTDISHQLKTPLASISLCNSLLEEDLEEEEKEEFLTRSNENINKLTLLIDALVNISRLEVAMIKLKPERRSYKETIVSAINSANIKAMDKNISIDIDSFDDYNIIHDKKWTEEAIFNVLDNAIKYTNNNGEINISVEENINYIKVKVKDNGRGINKAEYNNIFKRFYRGKDVENSKIEGSGVGLYLTRKIYEDQGGSVMVNSKLGKGTTFTLLLPK